jgi:hypothetical protein
MLAQPLHEAAHRGGEATLVQPDEVDDVAVRRLGSLSDTGGTIHVGYMPSPAGANRLPFTSSFSVNGVAID